MATSADYRQYSLPPQPHQAHIQPQQRQQQQPPQYNQQYPPQQQQQRPPRSASRSRTFSFHSQRSHKSSGSKDLHESPAEKEAKRLHTKADPTLAISEAEPSAVAAMMTQTIAPLRSIQHKDNSGNAIIDPDKSNPTRSRWERPLDTIRSFEAAIDGGYNRMSVYRSEADEIANWNKRSSLQPGVQRRYTAGDNYSINNTRPVSFRPETTQFDLGPRQSYFDPKMYANNSYGPGPDRVRMSRQQSEPQFPPYGRDRNVYPMPHKDRSYETVTSAAGSGSEQAGYQTDPTSSDNSSIDRASPAKRPEPVNDYGIGFSQSQSYQPHALAAGLGSQGRPEYSSNLAQPPAVAAGSDVTPRQKGTLLRRQSTQQQAARPAAQRPEPEKRKSWFSRRFSKQS